MKIDKKKMVTSHTYTMVTEKQTADNHKEVSKRMIDVELASKVIDNEINIAGLNKRKEIASTTTGSIDIVTPNDNDILSGRGAGINLHPGNIYYRNLIQSYKVQYVHSDPGQKKHIIKCVFNTAKQYGRFLKFDPITEEWKEVPDEEARKKVGQALRENATTIKKQKVPEVLKRKLDFQAPQSNSIPDYKNPRFGFDLVSSLNTSKLAHIYNGATVTSQILSPSLPSSRTPISHLWYQVNALQEKQEDLRQKQRELEDKQNQVMLQLYQQMITVASLNLPSSSESVSDISYNDYCFRSLPNKRRKFFESRLQQNEKK